MIRFRAILHEPDLRGEAADWTFLVLPEEASGRLPTRSMVSVEGKLNGAEFQATLTPDGQGSHWLKVTGELQKTANAKVGDEVALEIRPLEKEPEPVVPDDVQEMLDASAAARETWDDITPIARRDWIFWITSGKKAETRVRRIATAEDMLERGKRRACCFDRSGMYSKSLSSPKAKPLG